MNEKNNQQSNKKEHSIKSRDAINRVSTESDTDLKNMSLKEVIEGQSDTKEVSLRGGTTKQSQADNEIAVKVNNVSKIFKIPHAKIDSMRSMFVNMYVKKTYEEFYALKNVAFEVKKGEFFGIIGRNGSGKSTLLKILASVYQPTSGSIEINGMISPFLELGIGFNPELSGRDNIYLNATVLGMTKVQIDEKFNDMVRFAELEKFIDEQLKNYSSGMQMRLAFSVSIHANRDILLMDEVLAVGDSSFQKKCIDIFEGYSDSNRTVILVTHDISTVRKYCDRAMLLNDGKIIKIGDVDEVCDEYIMKNMSKEARAELEESERLKKEEKKREIKLRREQERKKKSNIGNIKYVEIYISNKNNKNKTVKTHDNFYIEIDVEISQLINDLHLAVQFFEKESNCFISGNNTQLDNFKCHWKMGKNRFRLCFEDCMLNNGEFYLKVLFFKYKDEGNIILNEYVFEKEENSLIAKTEKVSMSLLNLKHDWENIL